MYFLLFLASRPSKLFNAIKNSICLVRKCQVCRAIHGAFNFSPQKRAFRNRNHALAGLSEIIHGTIKPICIMNENLTIYYAPYGKNDSMAKSMRLNNYASIPPHNRNITIPECEETGMRGKNYRTFLIYTLEYFFIR